MNYKDYITDDIIAEAKRIFADSEKYENNVIVGYALLARAILAITNLEEFTDENMLISEMQESIKQLTAIEREIIESKYGLGGVEYLSQSQIAKIIGLPRNRIQQIEVTALRKLRKLSRLSFVIDREKSYNIITRSDNNCEPIKYKILENAKKSTDIYDLNLTVRTYNALICSGIITLGQILKKPDKDFLEIKNIGKNQYEEILRVKNAYKDKVTD